MKNMRQVIKTNQNFVTGEHYEQRVLKPVQAAQNRVTVQLYDAETNKLVEEATTENAISSVLESYAYGTIATILRDATPYGLPSLSPGIKCIELSDSDQAELQDPFFVHGNIVGSCNRNDISGSGTSPVKGTYNPAESYGRFEDNRTFHIHNVYDWPTSAGNGKIQQISWLSDAINTSYGPLQSAVQAATIYNSVSGAYVTFDRRGNTYYNHYKVLNDLAFLNGIEGAKLETEASFYTNYEVNDHYYSFSAQFSGAGTTSAALTLTINKYDTSGSLVDTWTEDLITSVPQLVQLKNNARLGSTGGRFNTAAALPYCDFDGWVGFSVTYCSTDYNVFPVRNSAGELVENSSTYATVYSFYNVLTKQWLHQPSPWDVWCTYTHYTSHTVLKKLSARHLCTSSNSPYCLSVLIANSDASGATLNYGHYTSYRLVSVHHTLPIGILSTTSIVVLRPVTAQTRLAAPITKTSLNTMKIQYDFFFKIPLPYMTPDHVWDLYK